MKIEQLYEEEIRAVQQEFPEITINEACVVFMRREQYTFAEIQHWLGNPSKKWIREVMLKYIPEYVEYK